MRTTQHHRLLACLSDPMNQGVGGWVSLKVILALGIAQYGRVINDLREGKVKALNKRKYIIENKTHWAGSSRYSWFRLPSKEKQLTLNDI